MKDKMFKQSVFYTFGVLFFRFSQWFIIVTLPKIFSYQECGVTSISVSIGSIFFMLSNFGIRNYQVVDRFNKHDESVYFTLPTLLIIISNIILLIYLIVFIKDRISSIVIFSFCLFNFFYSFTEPFAAKLQMIDELDKYGIAFTLTGLTNLIIFFIFGYLKKQFIFSICLGNLLSGCVLFLITIYFYYRKFGFKTFTINFSLEKNFKLVKDLFPVFMYTVTIMIINTYPKIYMNNKNENDLLGVFCIFSTFAILIPEFATAVFSPFVNKLSVLKESNKQIDFEHQIKLYFLCILLYLILCNSVIISLSKFFFSLLYGIEIVRHISSFYTIVLAMSFYTFVVCFIPVMLIYDKLKTITINAIIILLCLICFEQNFYSFPILKKQGYALLFSFFEQFLLILSLILFIMKNNAYKKNQELMNS